MSDSINPDASSWRAKPRRSLNELAKGIREGDISCLSEGITLLESTNAVYRNEGLCLLDELNTGQVRSKRIGITGVPGVGKSSIIEKLGLDFISRGEKVAVLSIDPSSSSTGGSILGDKTRMEQLSKSSKAFVRPTPNSTILGGVGKATWETILLCEAAGFTTIFVETVGVGQSEIAVSKIVDYSVVMLLPQSGDDLQGVKKGIMEIADIVLINKSEDDSLPQAKELQSNLNSVSGIGRNQVNVYLTSVLTGTGLNYIVKSISEYFTNKMDQVLDDRLDNQRVLVELMMLQDLTLKAKSSEKFKKLTDLVATNKFSFRNISKGLDDFFK